MWRYTSIPIIWQYTNIQIMWQYTEQVASITLIAPQSQSQQINLATCGIYSQCCHVHLVQDNRKATYTCGTVNIVSPENHCASQCTTAATINLATCDTVNIVALPLFPLGPHPHHLCHGKLAHNRDTKLRLHNTFCTSPWPLDPIQSQLF